MSLRIAIGVPGFGDLDTTPLRILESAGAEVRPNPHGRTLAEAEARDHVRDADGLLAGTEPLTRAVLESAPSLKAVAQVGMGLEDVDMNAAHELGIKVSNTPDGPTQAVAEMTIGALIALNRNLVFMNESVHRGEWARPMGAGVHGSQALVVGFGRIGQRVASWLHAMGAEVFVYDPYIDKSDLDAKYTPVEDLDGALGDADIVSLHAGRTGRGMRPACVLDARRVGLLKPSAVVLNSARGELVDDAALADALQSGRLRGVWCDAFLDEPYSGPLRNCPNALLTPHAAARTYQCRLSIEKTAVQNLLTDLGVPL